MAKVLHLALRHPKSGDVTFTGVVMPYKPPVDKVLAALLINYRSAVAIETLEFWTQNECPDEQFKAWRDSHVYPVDIADRKYHESGVGSASEFVAHEFAMELTPGFEKLVDLINRNNKTGMLKGYKFAVPFMLRELYELDGDLAFHTTVVQKTFDVLESYALVENGQIAQPIDGLEEALPDLIEQFAGCNYSPLTLGRYLRDRWLLGDDAAAIREKLNFWTSNFDDVQKKLAEGEASFRKLAPYECQVAGTTCAVIKTDNRFLAKAAIKSGRYGIRVIIGSDGHTVISTNGYDLKALAERLNELEPGKWYHQARMGALINGGPQYTGVTPTSMGFEQVTGLIKMLVQPKPAKGR